MTEPTDVFDNEELAAFISSTLKAIHSGVTQARDSSTMRRGNQTDSFVLPQEISFDIAVTAAKATETGGGLKIQVARVFGAGVTHKQSDNENVVSRVAFKVPLDTQIDHQRLNYNAPGIV